MHRHFLRNPDFKQMFVAEAKLAARVVHPNVVAVTDVLSLDEELLIVMEYVHGEALHALMRAVSYRQERCPIPVACAIVTAVLEGLHAAHEATDSHGEALNIVHRDVSPQNIIVGVDGVARVFDFGIAKALNAQRRTSPGVLKGKFSYMAPEVINGAALTRRADIFATGVVLWELLTARQMFNEETDSERMSRIVRGHYPSPRRFNPLVTAEIERVLARALSVDPSSRYPTALKFAVDLERTVRVASRHDVGEWVRRLVAPMLDERAALIRDVETSTYFSSRPSMASSPVFTTNAPVVYDPERRTRPDLGPTLRRRTLARRMAVGGAVLFGTLLPILWFYGQSRPTLAAGGVTPVFSAVAPPVTAVAPTIVPSIVHGEAVLAPKPQENPKLEGGGRRARRNSDVRRGALLR
jgi:serine/threonine-protein kinase